MRTRSTTPVRLFSLPIGSSMGITLRPKALVSDSSTRSASARSRSMRFTTISARRLILLAIIPDALGDDFDSGDAIDHHDRGIDHGQHHLRFVDEHVEAGSVENIDLGLAPLHAAEPTEIDILRAISSSS